ncbi:MAG: glycoside hydrolase family 20 protein [Phocaeicola plebeius]|uniref:beta-N-acetylhexosaminidase n=1 Tax=Phocaeicola plebeius TaxID=310297 RepID=UPI00306EEEF5
MKHLILYLIFTTLSIGCITADTTKPFVIPELKEWNSKKGTFQITPFTRISCNKNDKSLWKIAEIFSRDCKELLGFDLVLTEDKAKPGDIQFVCKKEKVKHSEEEYKIEISDKIIIRAPFYVGIYWGTRTLLQIAEQSKDRCISCGIIFDWPDYQLRGFMLDCGRKFFPMHFLMDYVKIMSYYKMNTFQIHLNDNAFPRFYNFDYNKTYSAFRLESDLFPELTAQDGWYTKDEFINLQILAEDNFVEIIPEIDVPAHSLAFSQYRPDLGSEKYGMDHLDLFKSSTYQFLDSLFTEFLGGENPVFRGKRVHIGTDEYSNKDSVVVERFRYFTDYYIKFMEKFGKQACIWGALTHAKGKTPVKSENVVMGIWYNGYADPIDMIKKGYKVISIPDRYLYISPLSGNYHDYLDTEFLYNSWTPADIGGINVGEKHPALLGGMFAVWNPHIVNGITTKDIHDRILPSMQTLSMKMWTGKDVTLPYKEFDIKRTLLSEAPGVNIAARIGVGKVFSKDLICCNERLPYEEVGYDYEVKFRLEGKEESKGTILFRSKDAIFYLSDPIKGLVGFTRDGYLNTFNYRIKNQSVEIRVVGDRSATSLYVNGRLIDRLEIAQQFFNSEKNKMKNVRSLVFPLRKSGQFKSIIKEFEVYQK